MFSLKPDNIFVLLICMHLIVYLRWTVSNSLTPCSIIDRDESSHLNAREKYLVRRRKVNSRSMQWIPFFRFFPSTFCESKYLIFYI